MKFEDYKELASEAAVKVCVCTVCDSDPLSGERGGVCPLA